MSISAYWHDKNKRAEKAIKHTEYMGSMYSKETKESIEKTETYDDSNVIIPNNNGKTTSIRLIESDTVSTALDATGKVCVLNFASFKNPGGMFIKGSCAQEECICHNSNLYNILRAKPEYYKKNNTRLNKALYLDRALYSPDVIFKRDDVVKKIDVLTCAAPNYTTASKYCNVSENENSEALRKRIRFILSILYAKQLDYVILGAFGCGVFGQDAEEVANIFIEEINNIYGDSKPTEFIFAVIDKDSINYKAFYKVITKYNEEN